MFKIYGNELKAKNIKQLIRNYSDNFHSVIRQSGNNLIYPKYQKPPQRPHGRMPKCHLSHR